MPVDAHTNFAYSTVATAPSPATSGTSLVLATGGGALMPAVPFNGTDWATNAQPTTANAEIVRVTAISGDTLTIVRAQEGSSARTIVIGDQFAATLTVKSLTDIESGDFSALATATFKVPIFAGAAPTANGAVAFDSTRETYLAGGHGTIKGVFPRVLSVQYSNTDQLAAQTVSNTETAFATQFALPANYLTANRLLRISAMFEYTTPGTAASQLIKLRLQKAGPTNTNLYQMGAAVTQTVSQTRSGGFQWLIQGTAAAGAAVAVDVGTLINMNNNTYVNGLAQPITVDTASAQTIQITNTFGTNTTGNTINLRELIIEELQ